MTARLIFIAGTLAFSSVVHAEHPAVDQRVALFEQVEQQTEKLEEMVDDGDWVNSANLASQLNQQVNRLLGLFPKESKGEGRSRDQVWENWHNFEGRLASLADAYDKAGKAAIKEDKAKLVRALDDATSSCRSCHMKYRSLW